MSRTIITCYIARQLLQIFEWLAVTPPNILQERQYVAGAHSIQPYFLYRQVENYYGGWMDNCRSRLFIISFIKIPNGRFVRDYVTFIFYSISILQIDIYEYIYLYQNQWRLVVRDEIWVQKVGVFRTNLQKFDSHIEISLVAKLQNKNLESTL